MGTGLPQHLLKCNKGTTKKLKAAASGIAVVHRKQVEAALGPLLIFRVRKDNLQKQNVKGQKTSCNCGRRHKKSKPKIINIFTRASSRQFLLGCTHNSGAPVGTATDEAIPARSISFHYQQLQEISVQKHSWLFGEHWHQRVCTIPQVTRAHDSSAAMLPF